MEDYQQYVGKVLRLTPKDEFDLIDVIDPWILWELLMTPSYDFECSNYGECQNPRI